MTVLNLTAALLFRWRLTPIAASPTRLLISTYFSETLSTTTEPVPR